MTDESDYALDLEHRYWAAFPDKPVPMIYWDKSDPDLWPLMEAALKAGKPLMPADLLAEQGMAMPPDGALS